MRGEDPGNGRAAVCDSGTLSGTSGREEWRRKCGHRASQMPSTVQDADLIVAQLPASAGKVVTIAVLSIGGRARTYEGASEYSAICGPFVGRGGIRAITLRDSRVLAFMINCGPLTEPAAAGR
jgi:hypothetical protein